jgi:hypothetical protein
MTKQWMGVLGFVASMACSTLLAATSTTEAARIPLLKARFATGDDVAWSRPDFADAAWREIGTTNNYENQGYAGYDGYAWYRIHVVIPSALKQSVYWPQRLRLFLSAIDDVDQTFFNGVKIGETGRFPGAPGGYDTAILFVGIRTMLLPFDSSMGRVVEDSIRVSLFSTWRR